MNIAMLDLALLQSYSEQIGMAMLKTMASKYEVVFDMYLTELAQCVTANDEAQWKVSCHKIKSAAASIGLSQVFALVGNMETFDGGDEQKRASVDALRECHNHTMIELRHWFKQGEQKLAVNA